MEKLMFNSSMGLKLSLEQMVVEIVSFMKMDDRRRYKISIGTDSEGLAEGHADFVTAVVIHRVGNGGKYFWRRVESGRFHTLRDRIIREVILSLDFAKEILSELKKMNIKFDFEIHADVGENGETKVMIQEVVGMIRAYDFIPQTKPASYAASSVADRHCG
jgi:uncharacterized protein